MSDTISCSDCKMEMIERRWTELLLNWLNKCVHPESPVSELSHASLLEIINKYKHDIYIENVDAIMSSGDIEQFIKCNYPILRLRYFWDLKDIPKKLMIMNTILLYHCCVSSQEGVVDEDICVHLEKYEQEMILKFCERLTDMEVTANNIECAIKDACDAIKPKPPQKTDTPPIEGKLDDKKLNSSVTLMPSAVTVPSSYSEIYDVVNYTSKSEASQNEPYDTTPKVQLNVEEHYKKNEEITEMDTAPDESKKPCEQPCACTRCSSNGPCCGEPGKSVYSSDQDKDNTTAEVYVTEGHRHVRHSQLRRNFGREVSWKDEGNSFPLNMIDKVWKVSLIVLAILLLIILIVVLVLAPWKTKPALTTATRMANIRKNTRLESRLFQLNSYVCRKGLCEKLFNPTTDYIYSSLSRCILLCTGPQLWPYPIGYTHFSKKLVLLATSKLEYKFQSVPSEAVHLYLAEAFKLFLGDLAKLERYTLDARSMNISKDATIKKMYIQMDVETDPDPRLRVDTDESYTVKVETLNNVVTIKLLAASFCGLRHALETLSQLILLDQTTGNLITLSNMVIKDAPSYRYRGLMIDTGRNYIPVPDIMRTIDAMATCKLNTFHWRISDVTSFPLHLPAVPQLFEYGSYARNLIYTKDDVKAVVKRAGIRGVRVLLEVAVPGPVGRAWSWIPEASCPTKNKNFTCNNVLCLRLGIHDSVFDILQIIYSEILEMTKIEDVFHLSDSVFSLANCFYLIEDREGFLDKALDRLKLANKGFLPKLPIIWYTPHLMKDFEARSWDRFGVQLSEWQPNPSNQFLGRFKVIHSSRWDLSCEIKKQRCKKYRTWQEMYSWKSWRNIEVFTIEGGEAVLWTDMVDTGNLDYHLWPRAAAVAERLWSDVALNGSVAPQVYVRLDNHRWRMVLKSVLVQPIWPLYCSFSPGPCLEKIKYK